MTELLTKFAASCGQSGFFGLPSWHKFLPKDDDASKVTGNCEVAFHLMRNNKFSGDDILAVSLGVIDMLLRIAALLALIFVIIGGIKYITAQGSPDGTKGAKDTIYNALLGLVISIIATAVVAFLGNKFTS